MIAPVDRYDESACLVSSGRSQSSNSKGLVDLVYAAPDLVDSRTAQNCIKLPGYHMAPYLGPEWELTRPAAATVCLAALPATMP